MIEKKYIFTDETIVYFGRTLHRIQAVKDFGTVKSGDFGGWVENEENLSHEGTCWTFGEGKIFDKVKVFGKAHIYGEAKVFGKAHIYGEAKVSGKACVSGEAKVSGKAYVSGEAKVSSKAHIYGEAKVFGEAHIYGEAKVFGEAIVLGTTTLRTTAFIQSQYDLLSIENIGSRNGTTTFYKTKEGGIDVVCGCFSGSIEEFLKAVEKTHGDNVHGRMYRHAVNYAKVVLI